MNPSPSAKTNAARAETIRCNITISPPRHPADEALGAWAAAVHGLYAAATVYAHPDERARSQARRRFEERLLAICQPDLNNPRAPQRTLCARIEKHLAELFVFVAHPEVPPDNNAAERSLRHLVGHAAFR